MALSLCAIPGDFKQPARAVITEGPHHQTASRVVSEQHAIPERLLTNKQAAALLSGVPAHLVVAKAQHRESFLQLTEPDLGTEPGMQLCNVAQGHDSDTCWGGGGGGTGTDQRLWGPWAGVRGNRG